MSTLPADFSNTRWSDSIERDVLNHSIRHSQPVTFTDSHRSIKVILKNAAVGFGKFFMKVSSAIYEARKEEIRLRTNYYR